MPKKKPTKSVKKPAKRARAKTSKTKRVKKIPAPAPTLLGSGPIREGGPPKPVRPDHMPGRRSQVPFSDYFGRTFAVLMIEETEDKNKVHVAGLVVCNTDQYKKALTPGILKTRMNTLLKEGKARLSRAFVPLDSLKGLFELATDKKVRHRIMDTRNAERELERLGFKPQFSRNLNRNHTTRIKQGIFALVEHDTRPRAKEAAGEIMIPESILQELANLAGCAVTSVQPAPAALLPSRTNGYLPPPLD